MEKQTFRKFSIIIFSFTISLAILIITLSFVAKTKKDEPEEWVLHSYGNTVALYNGKQMVEVFSGIMLDTLPADDRRQLDNGLAFTTREEAVNAIEDYDG